MSDYRTGFGVDIHRFEKGDGFLLGGVFIPCDKRVVAHSDGDVLYHALAQAIFSSIGEDDIGSFYPDDKNETKDMNSSKIVKHALSLLEEKEFSLTNINIALILQTPKLKDYKTSIKQNVAMLTKLGSDRISLHAGTAEKLGDIGREEGVVCFVSLLVRKG